MSNPSLIERASLDQLIPASDAKNIADAALELQEQRQIAYAINNAVNTGGYSCYYNHEISDNVKDIVEGQGYTLEKDPDAVHTIYKISWETPGEVEGG